MADLIVELHVPLVPTRELPDGAYPFPWLEPIQEAVMMLDLAGTGADYYDDGEEFGDHYVFFMTGTDEARVLRAAADIAGAQQLPAGAFLMVSDTDAEGFGRGRRVDLPLPPS